MDWGKMTPKQDIFGRHVTRIWFGWHRRGVTAGKTGATAGKTTRDLT